MHGYGLVTSVAGAVDRDVGSVLEAAFHDVSDSGCWLTVRPDATSGMMNASASAKDGTSGFLCGRKNLTLGNTSCERSEMIATGMYAVKC
jgi:hypothetical protein